LTYSRNYYKEHRLEILKKGKQYKESHKKELKIYQKIYAKTHKNEIKNRKKIYNLNNKEKIHNQQNKRQQERKKTDIRFRLSCNLRTRLAKVISRHSKSLSTMFLIGCEIDYLMYHLQEQFTEGMSWDNYGDWHIDHIKPCASFDLSKPEEQQKCFHYTNLQPLWAEDNIAKKDKYEN